MRHTKALRTLLFIAGLMLTVLGGWRLFDPITFFANNGLELTLDPGLLSEARGTGGVVVGLGLLVLRGAFSAEAVRTSVFAALVVFFGFASARLVGLVLDGNPGDAVLTGIASEVIMGTLIGTAAAHARRTFA
jgi:hypothetical protein